MQPIIKDVTWRDLPNNRLSRGLHPAMLSEQGYVKQSRVRLTGEEVKEIYYINYDHEYSLAYIGAYICKKLYTIGKQETLKLVAEAWDYQFPNYESSNNSDEEE